MISRIKLFVAGVLLTGLYYLAVAFQVHPCICEERSFKVGTEVEQGTQVEQGGICPLFTKMISYHPPEFYNLSRADYPNWHPSGTYIETPAIPYNCSPESSRYLSSFSQNPAMSLFAGFGAASMWSKFWFHDLTTIGMALGVLALIALLYFDYKAPRAAVLIVVVGFMHAAMAGLWPMVYFSTFLFVFFVLNNILTELRKARV